MIFWSSVKLHKGGVFRIQSNVYDGAFLQNKLTAFSR